MNHLSDKLVETFAPTRQPVLVVVWFNQRIDENLSRWMDDQVQVERSRLAKETVLDFCKRIEVQGSYRILSKAAKFLFAIPASSVQHWKGF